MKDFILLKGFLESGYALSSFDFLLKNIAWKNILKTNNGVDRKINRKMSYAYDTKVIYRYTNLNLEGEVWNERLIDIREKIAKETGFETNSVLLNLYENGKEEIRWHSDKEDILGDNPIIPMINLGASRTFWLRNKETGETEKYLLNNGDLFIMLENCQKNWLHAILKEKEVVEPRISLTYRKVIF